MQIKRITKSALDEFKTEWDKVATAVVWNPKKHYFGLFEGKKLIGYIFFDINGGVGHLHEIIVKAGHRRKNCGTALMEFFIDFCKKAGCHKLTLRTSEQHTEAMKFYEKLGFKVESTHPNDKNNLTWYTYCRYL